MCHANFTAGFVPLDLSMMLKRITFIVTDPQGTTYSSADVSQNVDANVNLVSVENYEANEKGQATKKITLNFDCTLRNGTDNLVLKNGRAVIAVAYD
jgi:hypothetical protein